MLRCTLKANIRTWGCKHAAAARDHEGEPFLRRNVINGDISTFAEIQDFENVAAFLATD